MKEKTKFIKKIRVRLPFHKIHEGFGVHGLDLYFILRGPKGAVQFIVNFPAYLPETLKYWDSKGIASKYRFEIFGYDLGCHSPTPLWEDQEAVNCDILHGGKCYYDGSSLKADLWVSEIFKADVDKPKQLIWHKLKEYYKETFVC